MEKLLIGGDATTVTLLMVFIIGILTKRFVPWWVHEEVLEKLKAYEDATPELIREMRRALQYVEEQKLLRDEETVTHPVTINPNLEPKPKHMRQKIRALKDKKQ